MDEADILNKRKQLAADRQVFESHWQELGEIFLPTRADFTTTRVVGDRRQVNIYDGVPMLARQSLATSVDALLKSRTTKWFGIRAVDDELNLLDGVKRWNQYVSETMWNAIYRPVARFVQRTSEVDNDLVTFGTGVLWIGENNTRTHLNFRSCHLKDTLIAENSDGVVDTCYYTLWLNKRQAIERYGEENLSKDLRKHRKEDDLFEFVHAVYPRDDYDPRRKNSKNLPFASCVIEVKTQHKVGESGYYEFPYAVPRWDTGTGEVYGRSPAMIALPDGLTLQAMGRTILKAGEKATDPPMWATDDAVIGTVRTFPGGLTIISSEAARESQGRPIGVLDTGKNLPIAREMQNDVRRQVEAAFFKNILQLPIEAPRMTATEVLQRKDEFLRMVGPIFGRLEADYIGVIVERVFGIMSRTPPRAPGWLGQFPPPPPELKGQELRFEFISPVQQMRKQIEAIGAMRGLEILQPFIQTDPSVLDNFDVDEISRDIPETFGTPFNWLRTPDQVKQIRQQRAQQQQVAQMAALAEQAAKAAKDGGAAVNQLSQAMMNGEDTEA